MTPVQEAMKCLMNGMTPEDLKDDFGSAVVEEAIEKLEERI